MRTHRCSLRKRPVLRVAALLSVALAVSLAVAACASDGSPAGSAATDDTATDDTAAGNGDPVLAFFQCLRSGGLDVADPGQGQIGGLQEQVDMDDPAVMAVVDDCRTTHLAATGGRVTVGDGNMGDNLADTAALIAFVDCMRDHGIDMPDPGPDGRIGLPENQDPQSSEFQAATRECAAHLSGGGILIGEPGGEGGMTTRGRP